MGAPAPGVAGPAGAGGVAVVVGAGAMVRAVVTGAVGREPVPYARVAYESIGGGASAQPANTGTVTRRDGTFELAGVPAGPLSLSISADGFHQRIEGSLVARDDGELGPLAIELAPLVDGEQPKIELVGIGVPLVAERDGLRADRV